VLDQYQYEVQRSKDDDGNHEVLQLSIKFASLKEQSLFHGDIPDGEPVEYRDAEVGQGSPDKLADAI
jgi:hypothetical protein